MTESREPEKVDHGARKKISSRTGNGYLDSLERPRNGPRILFARTLPSRVVHSIMNAPVPAVCPDDLGELEEVSGGVSCRQCGRLFRVTGGVPELLPREASLESSPESIQMNAYLASFSTRPERVWRRSLAAFLNTLGNGYLYHWAGRTLEGLANGRPEAVLDAACGDGSFRRYLVGGHDYTGVDFSARLLFRAKRYSPARYLRADLNHLPFRDSAFDMVVSLQALQYLERPATALGQLARVLKPDGRFLLSVPNRDAFKYRFQGIPKIQLQRFERKTLSAALNASFEILEIETQGLWLPIPVISAHVPGTYRASWGLSWTVVAKPRK